MLLHHHLIVLKSSKENEEAIKKLEIKVVIVALSRELGMQIVREVDKFLGSKNKKVIQQLVGGANQSRLEDTLSKKKPSIVVGAPGRISEISVAVKLHIHGCGYLVLDEVDELLSFIFREDIQRILDRVGRRSGADPCEIKSQLVRRAERQTILVSATVLFSVIRATRSWGHDPFLVQAKNVVPRHGLKEWRAMWRG